MAESKGVESISIGASITNFVIISKWPVAGTLVPNNATVLVLRFFLPERPSFCFLLLLILRLFSQAYVVLPCLWHNGYYEATGTPLSFQPLNL